MSWFKNSCNLTSFDKILDTKTSAKMSCFQKLIQLQFDEFLSKIRGLKKIRENVIVHKFMQFDEFFSTLIFCFFRLKVQKCPRVPHPGSLPLTECQTLRNSFNFVSNNPKRIIKLQSVPNWVSCPPTSIWAAKSPTKSPKTKTCRRESTIEMSNYSPFPKTPPKTFWTIRTPKLVNNQHQSILLRQHQSLRSKMKQKMGKTMEYLAKSLCPIWVHLRPAPLHDHL